MKIKVLKDVTVECSIPRWTYQYYKNIEDKCEALESWASDFNDFIRDHRSQDKVSLHLNKEYREICSFCKYEWYEDESGPACCNLAIKENEREQNEKSQK